MDEEQIHINDNCENRSRKKTVIICLIFVGYIFLTLGLLFGLINIFLCSYKIKCSGTDDLIFFFLGYAGIILGVILGVIPHCLLRLRKIN
jgi:vacuolar-type H+-ATPase subunit I/STV1